MEDFRNYPLNTDINLNINIHRKIFIKYINIIFCLIVYRKGCFSELYIAHFPFYCIQRLQIPWPSLQNIRDNTNLKVSVNIENVNVGIIWDIVVFVCSSLMAPLMAIGGGVTGISGGGLPMPGTGKAKHDKSIMRAVEGNVATMSSLFPGKGSRRKNVFFEWTGYLGKTHIKKSFL